MANRLIDETSPYLLQHAHNPVDWYPWCPEAFQTAKTNDRPVLLSVGYSACHWCHVMEEESFENAEIALLMNENFVCIKVDREERPDVDSVYMSAVQAMTGQGGWPLTVFLTPEGEPFFGGTYYPAEPRGGMPGFPQLLEAISDAYSNRRKDILETSKHIIEHVQSNIRPSISEHSFNSDHLNQAYANLDQQYDWNLGGFGGPIKFPQPFAHEFLLRYSYHDGDSSALEMVERSLRSMVSGGIYDHVGGGFHRYSTTSDWLIPHFEKMLYDNALLASLYFHTYQATQDSFYTCVGLDILNFISRDMTSPDGLFYSALDADSEGVEGAYYVWSVDELSSIVDKRTGSHFFESFDITKEGNFEGNNILRYPRESDKHPFLQDTTGELTPVRTKLLENRYKRIPPLKDKKVIFSWNALMCQAFLDGSAATGDRNLLQKAIINIKSLLKLTDQYGEVFRSWKDGKFSGYGFLEDYANFINVLTRAHGLTSDPVYLKEAVKLADTMVSKFWDNTDQVFYDTPNTGENLIYRPSEYYDNAVPSGASAACLALRDLSIIFNISKYNDIYQSVMGSIYPDACQHPTAFGNWMCGLADDLRDIVEVAIVGSTNDNIDKLRSIVLKTYLPNSVLICDATDEYLDNDRSQLMSSPLLKDRGGQENAATAYICKDYACELPVSNRETLIEILDAILIKGNGLESN